MEGQKEGRKLFSLLFERRTLSDWMDGLMEGQKEGSCWACHWNRMLTLEQDVVQLNGWKDGRKEAVELAVGKGH